MRAGRVALTGGVASGKSEVARVLRDLGAVVIDADVLAREVVAPGTPGLAAVVVEFGPGVLDAEGALDRAALGALVFGDDDASRHRRQALEAIVHPLVRARAGLLESDAGPDVTVVHDIPLLVETGQQADFDAVIVVDVPAHVQVERMMRDRGWSRAEAESRIAAQASREQRRAAATYVIDNTGTREDLRERVAEVFTRLTTNDSSA